MDNSARKRSSLKHENIFPEGMTVEQFVEINKNKSIKWDQKVIIEEETLNNDVEMTDNTKETIQDEPKVEQVSEDLQKMNVDGPQIMKRRSSR
jgi:hypothetical protein